MTCFQFLDIYVKHDGIKYPCDLCEFIADCLKYLKKHKKNAHEGSRHYPCDQCEYVANQLGSLKKHKKTTHDGIRYSCEQCGDIFKKTDSLKQHIATKHEGIRYHCDQCDYAGAANMSILRRHIKAKHGIT